MSKNHYHHGDLRQSLLTAATDMIGESGIEGLSMRKLADKVGVSRTAPYHHFKDKNELLCAIAEQGFIAKEEQLEGIQARFPGDEGLPLFERYVQEYIRFAYENSEQYDLMFSRDIWKKGQPTESLRAVSHRNFQNWMQWVESLQSLGVLPANNSGLRTAQVTWATLHGLCRLLNDGVYTNPSSLEDIGRTAVDMLIASGENAG